MAPTPAPTPIGPSKVNFVIPARTLAVFNATAKAGFGQKVVITCEDGSIDIDEMFTGKGENVPMVLDTKGAEYRYLKIEPAEKERTVEINFSNWKKNPNHSEASELLTPLPAPEIKNLVTIQTIGAEDWKDRNNTDTVLTVFLFPQKL